MTGGSGIRRMVLSLVLVLALGGGSLTLAVAGGHLKFTTAKPSLVKKTPAPLPITGFAPGDSAQRVITLQNRNTKTIRKMRIDLAERPLQKGERVVPAPAGKSTPEGYQWIKVCRWVKRKNGTRVKKCTTKLALAPSRLITDPDGLRVTIESCAKPWTALPTPSRTYSCSGVRKTLLSAVKLPLNKRLLKGLPQIKPKKKLYLRMTIALPITAGNQLQGRSARLLPTFVVAGTSK